MTDRQAAALFTLLLTCFTTWLCFRGIAWVVRNGWRSMLGLVAVRGEAVLTVDDDMAVADATKLDHFSVWEAELAGEKQIARHLRRMERWSR